MQKKLCLAIGMVVVLGLMVAPASAWLLTQGDTGWQTYSYTAGPSGFKGTAGFVVSCQGVLQLNSYLFLDNLSQCDQPNNKGFETGTYKGFTLVDLPGGSGISYGLVSSGIGGFLPKTGEYMSAQISQSEDTSGFLNFYGNPGTEGSILTTAIKLTAGKKFTFDWAFLGGNFGDFSLFYLRDSTTGDIIFQDGLGQELNLAAPIPTAAILFGSGLMGLVSWRRFRKS